MGLIFYFFMIPEGALPASQLMSGIHSFVVINILGGNPLAYVQSGLGYLLTSRNHLPDELGQDLCFRPLRPKLELNYALVWKRYAILSKASQAFLAHF